MTPHAMIRAIERTGYTVSTHDRRADGWHVVVIESPRGVDVVRVADPRRYDIDGAYQQWRTWMAQRWINRNGVAAKRHPALATTQQGEER